LCIQRYVAGRDRERVPCIQRLPPSVCLGIPSEELALVVQVGRSADGDCRCINRSLYRWYASHSRPVGVVGDRIVVDDVLCIEDDCCGRHDEGAAGCVESPCTGRIQGPSCKGVPCPDRSASLYRHRGPCVVQHSVRRSRGAAVGVVDDVVGLNPYGIERYRSLHILRIAVARARTNIPQLPAYEGIPIPAESVGWKRYHLVVVAGNRLHTSGTTVSAEVHHLGVPAVLVVDYKRTARLLERCGLYNTRIYVKRAEPGEIQYHVAASACNDGSQHQRYLARWKGCVGKVDGFP